MYYEFSGKIKIKRTSKCASRDGFNGYGKYRSNTNLPYGYLKDYQERAGIYYIQSKITGRIYIGCSKNIGSRISKHFSQLKKGNHPNYKLLEDYNTYGIDSFDFGVFELTDENLLDKEKEYQLKYDRSLLYNLQIKDTLRSDKQTAAMKSQDKSSHKTESYKAKMRRIKQNKIGQFDRTDGHLIEVFNNSDEVCAKYSVAKSTLLGCCNGSKKSAIGYIWRYLDDDNNVIAEGKGKVRTVIAKNEDIV